MSATSTALMTAEEFMELPDDDGFRYELINGELEKMPLPGPPHGRIAFRLAVHLGQFILGHELGEGFANDTGFQLTSNPDTVLGPDFAFVTNEHFAKGRDKKGYWPGAPDLAVEVLSPSDRPGKVKQRISRWFSLGAKQLWIVDPKHSTVTVYRSLGRLQIPRRFQALITWKHKISSRVSGFRWTKSSARLPELLKKACQFRRNNEYTE